MSASTTTLLDAGLVAKAWLATLGMVAVQGTLLALLALLLTRVGRLRPAWQAAIWLVVALKLALPWGPAMPYSLSDVIAMFTATNTPVAEPVVIVEGTTRVAAPAPAVWPALGWLALAFIWLAGALVVIARAVTAQRRTSNAARTGTAAPDDAQQLLATLAACAIDRSRFARIPGARTLLGTLGMRTPRLVVGDAETGPHVVGVLRPIIVVPPALLDEPALLRAALLHELAHVQRRDALARIIQIAAGAMMWWLPVMRIVHRKIEQAREAACDAFALEAADVSRPAYARLLVRMAQLRTPIGAPALAAHHARALDARVAAVLGPPARARLTIIHRIAIAGWAVVALGGARTASASEAPQVCRYTPQMAEALFLAYPDADLDGDGHLSRDEACDLQAELRRVVPEERSSRMQPDVEIDALLAEPLCCNCSELEVRSSPEPTTCQKL